MSGRRRPESPPRRSIRRTRERLICGIRGRRRLSYALLGSDLQHGEKCFLRNFDAADALHALLAFLLLLEQLALARDVAAVALGEHVLAQRLDRLARDDA